MPLQNMPLGVRITLRWWFWETAYTEVLTTRVELTFVREIYIYGGTLICKGVSLSVPAREEWLNHKRILTVKKAPTSGNFT